MAVDNMIPYRLVLMQLIVTISILTYGAMSHLKQIFSVIQKSSSHVQLVQDNASGLKEDL